MTAEIPEKLKANPVFAGFPVPFTALVDDKDIPNFHFRDDKKWARCARERLCGFCGKKLGWWITFIGDAKDVESRVFKNPAMHDACGRYAFAVREKMMGPGDRVALYLTRGFALARLGKGAGFRADAPKSVEWEEEKS